LPVDIKGCDYLESAAKKEGKNEEVLKKIVNKKKQHSLNKRAYF
jgi:hypothetical protein